MESISILDATQEARRNIEICNSCRYCEGICAVFPAIERKRRFDSEYIQYLANLCHNCTACYHACQYTTPHVFDMNVPQALTKVRQKSYEDYVWPGALSRVFKKNGTIVSLVTALTFTLIMLSALLYVDPDSLFAVHEGAGAFYRIIPHGIMVSIAGAIFLFAILAICLGVSRYWKAIGGRAAYLTNGSAMRQALLDAMTLKHLGSDGDGCNEEDSTFSNRRRVYHHFMMYGFLLCFAATSVATVYDYVFGWVAPYALTSLPVLLGTLGGIGIIIGTSGLIWVKLKMHDGPSWKAVFGMDYAFLSLLFWVSVTGLLLLGLRDTSAMGLLLIIHLGVVAALFAILPFSKFIHVFFRLGSLIKYHNEK